MLFFSNKTNGWFILLFVERKIDLKGWIINWAYTTVQEDEFIFKGNVTMKQFIMLWNNSFHNLNTLFLSFWQKNNQVSQKMCVFVFKILLYHILFVQNFFPLDKSSINALTKRYSWIPSKSQPTKKIPHQNKLRSIEHTLFLLSKTFQSTSHALSILSLYPHLCSKISPAFYINCNFYNILLCTAFFACLPYCCWQ